MKEGRFRFFNYLVIILVFLSAFVISSVIIFYSFDIDKSISGHAGNVGEVALQVEVAPENDPPLIQITDPIATTYTSHRTVINYSVSDAALQGCHYSLDSGITNVTIVCGNNVTGISSVQGNNIWTVYANDTSGNRNSSAVTFTVNIQEGGGGEGGGGGGGGGGYGALPEKRFVIQPREIVFNLFSEETSAQEIIVDNIGDMDIVIDIEIAGISSIAGLNTNRISIAPGKTEKVLLSVTAPKPGIYTGKVIFTSGNIVRETLVVINVKSRDGLFDASITIPESYKSVKEGVDIKALVSLSQIGPAQPRAQVNVTYLIKNFNGETLYSESEILFVENKLEYIKDFPTSSLNSGEYIAGIEVTYPGGFAVSSAHFSIVSFDSRMLIVIVLTIVALIVIFISIRRYLKSRKGGKR